MDSQENKLDSVGARLALLFSDYLEMTAYQASKETGISHQVLSNIMTGRSKPSVDTISALLKRWPLMNMNWLLSGQGLPFTSADVVLGKNPSVIAVNKERESAIPARPAHIPGDSYSTDLVAQAENVLLRQQLADKDRQMAKLTEMLEWVKNLVPATLGKLLSSSDAAHHGQPYGAVACVG